MPVIDARVRAIITFTGGETNQNASDTIVVDLRDNGNSGKLLLLHFKEKITISFNLTLQSK